jgi:cellulose synthase/poly-beta-1,6-N-acetylglucosamine synthase-like glycosyltransferase/spore germination protein YaaH/peptidoglycan/xylan/chitin deacetylase (PgdA/CDA1 family)
MNKEKQVFQASSPWRWKTFQWLSRLVIFFLALLIPVVWIAWKIDIKPQLPLFSQSHRKSPETNSPGLTKKEAAKYKGFASFFKAKQHNASVIAAEKKLAALKKKTETEKLRAGFYVDWDPQAWFSLQTHINDLNTVIPEWFFIDSSTGKIATQINSDTAAYNLMKKHNLKILPILSNADFRSHSGNFSGELLDKVLRNQERKEQLINDIVKYLQQYKLQGINLDFEELKESSIEPMNVFVKELSERLHPLGMLVTQDVMPNDEDFNVKELAKSEDYIFLMAYDQHWDESVPGPVSDQKWIEKVTDEIARKIPPSKIVLAIGGFGYDWPDGDDAESVTYQQAMSTARRFNSTIDFDNDSYNCSFSYTDNDSVDHKVFFVDAGGNFNAMRFADQYGTGGTALWRLGSEDERIWKFYNRDLSDEALAKQPFNFSSLSTLDIMTEKPDYYSQEGEVLDVVSNPQKGIIDIESDPTDNLVSEENYRQLPTRYVLRRFGKVLKEDTVSKNVKITRIQFGKTVTKDTVVQDIKVTKRVVLTFDDGPDPEYTPRILDILKKEKVPAAFFIVGINAENHLPLLKRIYREGFEIGNHSFTHPNMATVSAERAETEMEATRLLIEAATGRSTILFRAPYNADAEPSTLVELKPVERGKQDGYYTVGESIDPEDWNLESGVNADSIYDRIVRRYESDSTRGIILLHDAGGNREATVQALPRIIQYFKSHNVKFATISEILNLPKDAIMPPVHTDMVKFSGWASAVLYWIEKLLVGAFWLAIVLGLGRILFMGVLATIQYSRSKKEKKLLTAFTPGKVSIIVPAYNEEVNAIKTIENLLQQDYPDIEIIFVNDGSTDNTFEKVANTFLNNSKVKVFTKPNGGKASALNFGISSSDGDYLVCIDADTQLMPDAVSQMMKYLREPGVGAVAGNVKVGNDRSVLTTWQSIEYTTAQNFDRRAFDLINCITVVPGAIGAFKREAIVKAGGFTSDTLAEDCDLTIRILRNGYLVRNCTEAIAITEAPETLKQFMKQRFRWNYGIMQSFWKNKDACFNPSYKSLGLVALPNILLFQILTPIFAPIADLLFILSLIWNRHDPESMHQILFFYALFLVVDVAASLLAFAFEREKPYKLIWLLPQRFAYRQLIYVVLFRSFRQAIKGETQSWGVLKRTGNVKLIRNKSFINPH